MKSAEVDSWVFSSASCGSEEIEGPDAVQNWLTALNAVMAEEKLSKTDVAERVGKTPQYISGMLKNPDKANPAGRLMDEVARKIGRMDLSSFILFGAEKRKGSDIRSSERRGIAIPAIVGVDEEGGLRYSYRQEDGMTRARESELLARKLEPGKLAIYVLSNKDLAPQFPEKTKFRIDMRATTPKSGQYYLVKFFGELAMRRIEFNESGHLILHAHNPTVGSVNPAAMGEGSEDLFQIIGAAYGADLPMG